MAAAFQDPLPASIRGCGLRGAVMIFFVLDRVDTVLREDVIHVGYEALSDFVAAPLRSGMILLVIAYGFRFMKGNIQGESLLDAGWLVVKMAVVLELTLNWPLFDQWVLSIVWDTYGGLAGAMARPLEAGGVIPGAPKLFAFALHYDAPTSTWVTRFDGAVLDRAFMGQLESAYAKIVGIPDFTTLTTIDIPIPGSGLFGGITIPLPVPFPNIMGNIAGVIQLVMTIVLYASVFIVLLLSRLGLTSCLAVAPIFIALALFKPTRSYTDAWFRGMLGFILTPMLLVLVLLVGEAAINIMETHGETAWSVTWSSGASATLRLFGPIIATLLLYYALAKSVAQVPQFASGLVGSLLANLGDDAARGLVGQIHKGVDAGVGAIKGGVMGAAGGPAGIKAGAMKGAAKGLGGG
ncbi:type IV secretion system protein [Hydrogenophaga sp.]|uniref:type IV secretion system protein n=1 Tax=Hydrogenophaga sp. TaxID=1904254 RepID=UPI00262D6BB7|nr:type IV secretion system protein [Hydrogenophaga sp.]MCW5654238.1 type IV secretion system protein [Hydrogenophaga sp.]